MSTELSRRQFLAGLGITGAGIALAACAPPAPAVEEKPKEEAKPEAPPPKPAAEQVEVRYMGWWGEFNTQILPQIAEDFKDVMPNVTIKLEEVGYGETEQKYPTTLVAGTAADILYHMNFMSKFYDEGLILDLTPRYDVDGIDFQKDFYHGLGINEWGGKLYGFPHMFESCIMLYNVDMVKEYWGKDLWEAFPDGNWDISDMIQVAKACTQDLDGDGKTDQWGLYIYHRSYYYGYETQSWTRGDNIFDIQNMKYNFTSDIVRQISHDLCDWVRKDGFVISQEDYSEVTKAAAVSFPFLAGKVAMRIRMSPDVGRALKAAPEFNWDLFYLPNSGSNQAVTRAGGHGNNVYARTKVPDEAWEVVKFMGMSPGQKYLADTRNSLPVYRKDSSLRETFLRGEPPHDDVLFGVLENKGGYGDHMRFHNESECLNLFQNKLDLLYNEPYEEAASKLDQYMADVEKEMNAIVDYGDELPFKGVQFPFKV